MELKSYFDTIPHGRLMNRVLQRVAHGRMLNLLEELLKAKILNRLDEAKPDMDAPLSPLLSNIYLNPLDHLIVSRGFEMVRYAYDFR